MTEREWSPQQQDIFDWFKGGQGNLVVRARAGTGKTTTILEAINYAPESRILLCAFNKRIADELTARLRNPKAQAKTLHSVGFGYVRNNWRGVVVDQDRGFKLARQAWARTYGKDPDSAPDPVLYIVSRLASVGKSVSPRADITELVDLSNVFNIALDNEWGNEYSQADVARLAQVAMRLAGEKDGTVDYDDMIYLPVLHRWTRPTFDLICVDEAQDMNASQLELARGLSRGRTVVVGDDRQAIYGFRGADSNAIDRLKVELRAAELPLTTTYRCPKLVVAQAQALVPDFTAADSAPQGAVQTATTYRMEQMAEPSDFVLSRTNAPLARICLSMLRAGKRARIEGRDVAKSLVSLVRRMRSGTIPELTERLERWADRERAKLIASRRPSAKVRLDYIADQLETIEALSDGLAEVGELVARIEEMFGESRVPCVVLSTVHKAKGLEADRVFVLADTLYCNGKRKGLEEENIHYVAVTRAKQTLVLVSDKQGGN